MTGFPYLYAEFQCAMEGEGRFQKLNTNGGRSGLSRRGSADNRQEERKVIPFAIAHRGSLRTADGSQWVITLWDLSRTGLCVIASGQVDLPVATSCELTLTKVMGTVMVNFQAQLMWFSDDSFQTYLGMKFELPTELPPDTFLERYLKANFDV